MKHKLGQIIRLTLAIALLAFTSQHAMALDKSFYADSSKLASGTWVKIQVSESGIYQITADDARNWGLGSDLSQIHVFGYGGAPLSETMNSAYSDDLPQVPVVRSNDRILFYGQGPTTWKRLNSNFTQLQVQHPYANGGYYLVTNDSRFNDVAVTTATNSPTGEVQTTYVERLYHENDIINPGETGRTYLGEDFSSTKSQSFKFSLDGLVSGSTVKVYTVFGAKTLGAKSEVSFSYNGTSLATDNNDIMSPAASIANDHYDLAKSLKTFTLDGTTELTWAVKFSCTGTVYLARLDYITVNYERALSLPSSGSFTFGLQNASTGSSYRVSNCNSATRVWDVTQAWAPVQMQTTGSGELTFSPATSGRREFVVFDESGTYSHPTLVEASVENQNIHGEATPDMIILAPSDYLAQAQRIADMHEQVDNWRVLVLDHEKVFNEFSSGTPDAMAYRRLCKMFWDRGTSTDGHKLGYLLLAGGGTFDNRLIGTTASTFSYPHLLTWQSESSSTEDNSITTDDYFGILADGSGTGHAEDMDIAVGRFPVRSLSEMRTVTNKLIKYVTTPDYGSWKNQVLNVADDEDNAIHMQQAETVIETARANGGDDMVYNYVFIDAFNAVSEGGSRTYPDARAKLFARLNEGTLWWNYTGHASTQNWTGEGLLKRVDVDNNLYYRHLPVLYAATCEYLRFDASTVSSGELVFKNGNGGAIAVLCPPRLAYITYNGALNMKVATYMFSRDASGKQRRIGDMLRLAKNDIESSTDNNRRFFVYGDPAMRLAYAPYTAVIETINGKAVSSDNMPVFKAREKVQFAGKIVDQQGNVVPGFDGTVVSTLFDCEQSVTTNGYGAGVPFTYEDRSNRLAISVDTVQAGHFTINVVIPTEVNNEYDNYRPALINLYASDSRDTLEAKGACDDFYIYGYADDVAADTVGPTIISFGLNDENFVDGSDVNESPLVLATVSDESGVNFSASGIGHSMTLTLDGTTSYNDVVSYYTPQYASTGTLGSINYALSDLSQGIHTLRLRVWDVYSNVSEKTISFNVVPGLTPEIADVYAAANPASVETTFYVKHNRPDAVVSVGIEVFDLMGRKVWSTTQSGRSDMYTATPITWDLTDSGGRRVPRGIYIYRATISTDGVQEATKSKKLAVTGE